MGGGGMGSGMGGGGGMGGGMSSGMGGGGMGSGMGGSRPAGADVGRPARAPSTMISYTGTPQVMICSSMTHMTVMDRYNCRAVRQVQQCVEFYWPVIQCPTILRCAPDVALLIDVTCMDTGLHDSCVERTEPVGAVGVCGLVPSLAVVPVRCLRAVNSVESRRHLHDEIWQR
jgi:hypothetical protein